MNKPAPTSVIKSSPAILVNKNGLQNITDTVACERSYDFFLNRQMAARVNVSPEDLEYYAVGWVVSNGFLMYEDIVEIEISEREISVYSASGKSVSGGPRSEVKPVSSSLKIKAEVVLSSSRDLHLWGENWKKTGGFHIALLFNEEGIIWKTEDIGRHNAVDKVIGFALRSGIRLSECFLVCSGRQPENMIAKAGRAGIPVIISRASTTDKGIRLAERVGITLIGFAREDRFTIYSHPERIES
ncbi:MAG: formate dehydrogenase accessory sulfurtransferase FdhD [Pseudomonadota bacterium]